MSGDSQKLLDLASECEQAPAGRRDLDFQIRRAIAGEPTEFEMCWTAQQAVKWADGSSSDERMTPVYTASLDSALTLVPKKAMWSVCDMEAGPFAQVIRPTGDGGYLNGLTSASGESPALALVAAALRARAAI